MSFIVAKSVKSFRKGDITKQEFNHLISLGVHGNEQLEPEIAESEIVFESFVDCMPLVKRKALEKPTTISENPFNILRAALT